MTYSKDVSNVNSFANQVGFGLGESQSVQKPGENLNLGKIANSVNTDSVAKRIKDNAIATVIQYEGDNTTFIWKHPIEDFDTGSLLIVHESQEAVFFRNGEALDLFGPGRHTLETQNLPLVGKLFKAPTGGVTPFHCEVYFINRTEQMAIKWGTDSQLEYIEPTYKFPIKLGASGEMSVRVDNSRKLLIKLVGTEKEFNHQALTRVFRAFLVTRVKSHLATQIKRDGISVFELDENLERLSSLLYEVMSPDFEDYGLSLERFFITNVVKPEGDGTYQRFRDLYFRQYADVAEAKLRQQVGVIEQQTEAQRLIIEAQGVAQKRALEGYTYQEERSFDVAAKMADNEAIGQMSNLGIGLGIMGGVGSTVGGVVRNAIEPAVSGVGMPNVSAFGVAAPSESNESEPVNTSTPLPTKFCQECGKKIPRSSKFCPECGAELGEN